MFCHIWNILCGMRYLFIVEEQTLIPLVSRLVVFLYPFLRKEEVKEHEKIIYQPADARQDRRGNQGRTRQSN